MPTDEQFEEFERLSRPPRKLTDFVSQEFLYEYTQGALDEERKKALENQLAGNAELRAELKTILLAEKYTATLAQTRVSPLHLEDLAKIRPLTELVVDKMKWRRWPDPMKWAAESLAVSIVIALIAVYLPWEKVNLKFPQRAADATLTVVNPDIAPTQAPVPAPTEQTSTPASDSATAPTPTPVVAKPAPVVAPTPTPVPTKGELYSVMMSFPITEAAAMEIREKILISGGAKAGQVELGWQKRDLSGRYYHFSLPENKYDEMISYLGRFGQVRIYKSQHPRVMPKGQLRIILEIENTGGNEKGQ